jgi:hypothetical protein
MQASMYQELYATVQMYSALPDVYDPLHLIPKAQCTRLKSWRVGKIIENGFKRMNIKKSNLYLSPSNLYYLFQRNMIMNER